MGKRTFIVLLTVLLSIASLFPKWSTAAEVTSPAGRQDRTIDSLKSLIAASEQDTSVCTAYLDWADQIYLHSLDSALILWQIAHDLAEENLMHQNKLSHREEKKFRLLLATSLHNLGFGYKYKGNVEKALEYYYKGLVIQEEIEDKLGIAVSYNNIGTLYFDQGNVQKALAQQFKSLKIHEEIGNVLGISTALNNIGNIYDSQGDLESALDFYTQCIKLCEEEESLKGELGDTYWNASELYKDLNDSLNHILYLEKAAAAYFKHNTLFGDASAFYTKGDIANALNHPDSAIYYYRKAIPLYKKIERQDYVSWSYREVSACLIKKGEFHNAQYYADSSLNIARNLGAVEDQAKSAALLTKIYKHQHNFEGALSMYELEVKMNDSLKNEATQKSTIRQQTKYEFEKAQLVKEQEERELARIEAEKTSRRDNLQYSVVLICLLVIGVLVAMLGRLSLPERVAEGIIFFAFLILFEFLLVLADPYIDEWSGGAPGFKLLFNAGIAALIFPMHSLFETKLKGRLVKS